MWPLLDNFVDVGIDGRHDIQPGIGMDLKALKERYAGKLCPSGGVNCETLIEDPSEKAWKEVRYTIAHAARQAVHDFGRYPIARI